MVVTVAFLKTVEGREESSKPYTEHKLIALFQIVRRLSCFQE